MKLAIPSTLMLCFEWWIYEIGGFLAGNLSEQLLVIGVLLSKHNLFSSFLIGMLGEIDLAAQHVVIMVAYINYMVT